MTVKRNPNGSLEIKITGDPVVDNFGNRAQTLTEKLNELAYQRLQLTRQVEDIDKVISQMEGAKVANDFVQKDIDLKETIAQAQKEAADKRATDKKAAEEAAAKT